MNDPIEFESVTEWPESRQGARWALVADALARGEIVRIAADNRGVKSASAALAHRLRGRRIQTRKVHGFVYVRLAPADEVEP